MIKFSDSRGCPVDGSQFRAVTGRVSVLTKIANTNETASLDSSVDS